MKETVQAALKGTLKNAQDQIDAKVKQDRKDAREAQRKNQDTLNAAIEKGRQRPMLIDSYASGTARSNLAKITNLKNFVDIMKKNGNSKEMIERTLTPAEKDQLEELEFKEKQMAYLGKKLDDK